MKTWALDCLINIACVSLHIGFTLINSLSVSALNNVDIGFTLINSLSLTALNNDSWWQLIQEKDGFSTFEYHTRS